MHSILALGAFLLLSSPKVDGPYTQGKLAVYVLRGPETDGRSYITLDEGLKSGVVKVRERGSGEVDTLEVENRSDKFLFLHVGDVIRGGKQDRTLATDAVVPPRSTPVAIDAFCVEHGRWRADAVTALGFSVNDAMLSGTALKRAVQADRNQQEVWSRVAETEARAAEYVAAPSPSLSNSGTYSAVVENETLRVDREKLLGELLPQVTAHEDALGVVVAIGGEVVGADVYASHALFRKLARKVLDSYVQESILSERASTGTPTKDEVERFLEKGGSAHTEPISNAMERRQSENSAAQVFEYRVPGDEKVLHASYVRKK